MSRKGVLLRSQRPDFSALQEHPDSGDACGSGGDAGGRIFARDSTEREDRDIFGRIDGGAERFQAQSGQLSVWDRLLKDWREEDERVRGSRMRVTLRLFANGENVFHRMAGVAEDGVSPGVGKDGARFGSGG